MPICQNCNSVVDEDSIQCPFCGKLIESKHNLREQIKITEQSTSENISSVIQGTGKNVVFLEEEEEEQVENLIIHSTATEELELQEYKEQGIPLSLEILPQRNYFIWLVIGFASFGIGFLVYLYLNLEDLEKHANYPNEFKAEPIELRASQILILFLISICFLFIPILWYIYYLKYATLYKHLKNQKQATAPKKLPHPAFYLTPLILSHLSALVHPIIYSFTNIDIRTTLPWLFWLIVGFVIVFTIPTYVLDFLWQQAYNEHAQMVMKQLGVLTEKHE